MKFYKLILKIHGKESVVQIKNIKAEVGASATDSFSENMEFTKGNMQFTNSQLRSLLINLMIEIGRLDYLAGIFRKQTLVDLDHDCSQFVQAIEQLEDSVSSWSDFLTRRGRS